MKALFIAFFSSFFLTLVTTSQLYQDLSDSDEAPQDEVKDFFRLLLLSRYGPGAPDYPDQEEDSLSDSYFYNANSGKPVPFRQAVQNYVDWKKENLPYPDDQRNSKERNIKIHESQHIKKNRQNNKEDKSNAKIVPTEENTTELQSTATSGPDLLASMPPVTPNKGQKEYVMLRPPVDNHRKIEHWMQSMANGIFGAENHLIQKRGSVKAVKNSN